MLLDLVGWQEECYRYPHWYGPNGYGRQAEQHVYAYSFFIHVRFLD
jgi:hypothetical protein